MKKSFTVLISFVLTLMLNAGLDASWPSESGPVLPEHGRLAKVKDKDTVHCTANLVIKSDDGKQQVEMPCQYISFWEKGFPSTPGRDPEDWTKKFSVLRTDEYASPVLSGGDNFSHYLSKKTRFILPTPFREDKETASGIDDLFSYLCDEQHCEFPVSPSLDTFYRGSVKCYNRMNDKDLDSLSKMFNRCQEEMRSGYRLDDSILVVCRVMAENDGGYAPARADGEYFGVYEISHEQYKALCKLRALRGLGTEAAPVVLFEHGGASYRIVDQSQLVRDSDRAGRYLLAFDFGNPTSDKRDAA